MGIFDRQRRWSVCEERRQLMKKDSPLEIILLSVWNGCKKGIRTLIQDKLREKLERIKKDENK